MLAVCTMSCLLIEFNFCLYRLHIIETSHEAQIEINDFLEKVSSHRKFVWYKL
jgi:hypothetical protein